ncbi:O-antigen ligase family protein [Marinibacterium sp. SX1]|uniref:O-antigen ligase family protein n=1 Tax=Marinibacterium sp. SX1 TaxID=3388424 RepID=UPI003D166629
MFSLSFSGRHYRVSEELRDHVLVTLWLIVTFKQFRYDELILYPLALYFLYAFLRDFPRLFPIIARSLVLWLYPAWWLLSFSWGADTGHILKSGMQLVLTVMICYCSIIRLGPRQIMLSLLIAAGWFGILSFLASPSGGVAARGVFSSKNSLGTAMVILWIAALCIALDKGFARPIRLIAVAAGLLALRMIQVANSATAVLLALAALAIACTVRARSLFSGPALLAALFLLFGAITVLAAAISLYVPVFDPVTQVLGAFGKDATLTGRTVLWQYATDEIVRRPYLGIGPGGFWTPEDGLSTARRIYEEFHKKSYAHFSFHSSFYEIAVHLGLIGLGIVVVTALWCLFRIARAALMTAAMPAVFFLCITMITLARSFTEVGLMAPFAQLSMLMTMGALLTLKSASRPATELAPYILPPGSRIPARRGPVGMAGAPS